MTTISNQDLNNAIYEVITHQYKKDCKDAHRIVTDAGYTISKITGGYKVTNPSNPSREIFLTKSRGWSPAYYIISSYFINRTPLTKKYDFVHCLNKPVNPIRKDPYSEKGTAAERFDRLRSKKWYVCYHDRRVFELEKKITQLQEDILYHKKNRIKEFESLQKYRSEIGLSHKEYVVCADEDGIAVE